MSDLKPGDFLYQSDQELFLVVIEEKEDSYSLAAHGWRDIDKDRIEEYIEDDKSKVHRQQEIEKLIEEKADEEEKQKFEQLIELFEVYDGANIVEDGPQSDFALEEK